MDHTQHDERMEKFRGMVIKILGEDVPEELPPMVGSIIIICEVTTEQGETMLLSLSDSTPLWTQMGMVQSRLETLKREWNEYGEVE